MDQATPFTLPKLLIHLSKVDHGMDLMGWTMVFKISQSSEIPAFLAMQVMDQANQMQAAGGDLVHLEIGKYLQQKYLYINLLLIFRFHEDLKFDYLICANFVMQYLLELPLNQFFPK